MAIIENNCTSVINNNSYPAAYVQTVPAPSPPVLYQVDPSKSGSIPQQKGYNLLGKRLDIQVIVYNLLHSEISDVNLRGYFHRERMAIQAEWARKYDADRIMEIKRDFYLFVDALPNTNVTHLDLSNSNCLRDDEITYLARTLPQTKITELSLNRCNITVKGAEELGKYLAHSKIAKLNLTSNWMGEESICFIAQGLRDSSIEELNLSGNISPYIYTPGQYGRRELVRSDNKGLIALSESLRESKLRKLNLADCEITYEGLVAIQELISNSNLEELILDSNPLAYSSVSGDRDRYLIAELLVGSKLKKLSLANCNIFHAGAVLIFRNLCYSQIEEINLNNNGIDFNFERQRESLDQMFRSLLQTSILQKIALDNEYCVTEEAKEKFVKGLAEKNIEVSISEISYDWY